MDIITLHIVEENQLLTLKSDVYNIGSRFDNMAQKLVFVRPFGRESDNLVLYFKTFYKRYGPINLGTQNEFIITNALTAQLELDLQIAFSTGEPVKHSNIIRFKLRESIRRPGVQDIDSKADPLSQLSQEAFTDAAFDGLALTYYNLAGDPVKELEITSELKNNLTAVIGEF